MAIVPVPLRMFELLALSLPEGPNFEGEPIAGWAVDDDTAAGAVLKMQSGKFSYVVLRRRIDRVPVPIYPASTFDSESAAGNGMFSAFKVGCPPEPLPSGVRKHPAISDLGARKPGGNFLILCAETHAPARVAIEAAYLAMPQPGPNFVSDFQTDNFDSRLWELYLVAAFREQGSRVTQPFVSPDFLVERSGHRCHIEAVTTHLPGEKLQGNQAPVHAPDDKRERVLGLAAVRFAKTLRSKLQKRYHELPHVVDQPFAIAIADFHAPSTMTWSREALPSYLYGSFAYAMQTDQGRQAIEEKVGTLLGEQKIPAGLFRDPANRYLSAVIFSNSATLGKFNRMGFLAGIAFPGLRMIRHGLLFDRTPGALDPIRFAFDLQDEAYAEMWPWGEAWCQELEVYHNPLAVHPIHFDLLPGATHWFEKGGEVQCSTMWATSVLSSVTRLIQLDPNDSGAVERYENYLRALKADCET